VFLAADLGFQKKLLYCMYNELENWVSIRGRGRKRTLEGKEEDVEKNTP